MTQKSKISRALLVVLILSAACFGAGMFFYSWILHIVTAQYRGINTMMPSLGSSILNNIKFALITAAIPLSISLVWAITGTKRFWKRLLSGVIIAGAPVVGLLICILYIKTKSSLYSNYYYDVNSTMVIKPNFNGFIDYYFWGLVAGILLGVVVVLIRGRKKPEPATVPPVATDKKNHPI